MAMTSSPLKILPIETGARHMCLDLGRPCSLISSAILGGGIGSARYIVNRTVDNLWCPADPVAEMQTYLRRYNLDPRDTVGLITAVPVERVKRAIFESNPWKIEVWVTAGIGNAAQAGGVFPLGQKLAGTINIIAVMHGRLTSAGLVGAVQTATEAKTLALFEWGAKTRFGEEATGTTTDTVTIANLCDVPVSPYAGAATDVGHLLGRAVRSTVREALMEIPPCR